MRDFGGLAGADPVEVARPGSVAELAGIVRDAASRGLPVVPRGCGHSVFGQSLAPGGITVETRGLSEIMEVGIGHAVVRAGALWREVLEATLPCGLMPPVLPDWLDLSVGGTLSAGGIGGTSFRYGTQADHLLAAEVVTGRGEVLSCSERERRDLFDAVRGGMGRCGILVTATLELVRAPVRVRTFKAVLPTVQALVQVQRELAARGEAAELAGQAKLGEDGWRFEVMAGVYDKDTPPGGLPRPGDVPCEVKDFSFAGFADRMRADTEVLRELGEWTRPHPWAVMFLPAERTARVVGETLAMLGRDGLGVSGRVLVNPTGGRTPLVPMPPEPFHFGVLRTASEGCAEPGESLAANRKLYERVVAAGGQRYPVDAVPFAETDWRRHFGRRWDTVRAAERGYGTAGVRGA
jgi:FAD/FMN-containing dehydrogenase